MTNNKARKLKRKEGKQRNDADDKRKKEKELEKRQKENRPVKKVRMLKDGSVAFGHSFKFGRVGMITTGVILTCLGLFIAGLNGAYDDYLPDVKSDRGMYFSLTYEECELIDFNNDVCALDYKFCREYADGERICQYAETDPFVNMDPNEKRFTAEEQDFLPPTMFLSPGFFPEAYAEPRNHMTIGLFKSNSCITSTASGLDTCPKYEDLVNLFDNTNQAMSGKFVFSEEMNDIYRVSPDFKSHYNFYQYAGLPTILAVDPDAKWYGCCMDARIFIEPSNFVYYDSESLAVDTGVWDIELDDDGNPIWDEKRLTLQKNVYIDGCSFARVASNMTLITQTINYFWNQCEGRSPEIFDYTYIPSIPIDYDDHMWYKYSEWINQMTQTCKSKC